MTVNTQEELYRLAYAEVTREEYPTPIPTKETEIAAKIIEWQQFHAGTLAGIPTDPAAAHAMHDRIGSELAALIAEDALIRENNAEAIMDTDAANNAAIAAFIAVPANIERAAWIAIRAERLRLLRETDYVMLEDTEPPAGTKQAWKNYRKALRDIPATYTRSEDVVWPTAPG
jgi:GMP synthase PP-ATPase subunit